VEEEGVCLPVVEEDDEDRDCVVAGFEAGCLDFWLFLLFAGCPRIFEAVSWMMAFVFGLVATVLSATKLTFGGEPLASEGPLSFLGIDVLTLFFERKGTFLSASSSTSEHQKRRKVIYV